MKIRPNEMAALEQVERAIVKSNSKQARFGKTPDSGVFFNSVMRWVADARDTEPPYLADSRTRDAWLSTFWRREPHLAGVLSSVNAIDSNRGWHMTGGRNQVARFTRVLRQAEDGEGWRQYVSMQSTAYYTTDLGALTETARDGRGGPLADIYHLDPTKCYLTGDRNAPLKYNTSKLAWSRDDFFRLTSMRDIQEQYHGLGMCAVSRVLDLCKIMLAVYNHELEQLGARAPKGLLLLQNIGQNQWVEAMKARDASLDSDMRRYYNAVAVIAQEGVENIDAKLVALSQLPNGFDIKVFTDLLMYAYALCIGYDPIEFWPVTAGQLGRGRETDIQHRKGTGKGGLNFMLAYQDQMLDQLPDTIAFEFEQRDQEGVLLDAEVAQAWANVAATLYGGGSSEEPGPAGDKGGDGEPAKGKATPDAPAEEPDSKPVPAANTVKKKSGEPILSRDEVRMLLVMKGVIPAAWTDQMEDVTSTDVKNLEERMIREELLENDRVLRAVYQYPNEPIVRATWDAATGKVKTKVVFWNRDDAFRATRYTVLKPTALIPDFTKEPFLGAEVEGEVESETVTEEIDDGGVESYEYRHEHDHEEGAAVRTGPLGDDWGDQAGSDQGEKRAVDHDSRVS